MSFLLLWVYVWGVGYRWLGLDCVVTPHTITLTLFADECLIYKAIKSVQD